MTSRLRTGLLCCALGWLAGCGGEPTEDCRTEGCDAPRVCLEDTGDGSASCVCPDSTVEEMGECVEAPACMDGECGEDGTCDGLVCVCATGRAGARCERCADGYHDDGADGCTMDACLPNPCEFDRVCSLTESGVACLCPAGQHDEGGECVPDTTCMPGTCAGHGECDDAAGRIMCTCDDGWDGTHCDACDELGGYHNDGAGGCTMDVCLPNPCTGANQTQCGTDMMGDVTCGCDAGYHSDGLGGCAADEACDARCGDHGTCSAAGGEVICGCDTGWTGALCDACDSEGGYHPDGAGACTMDACLPNPCSEANRGVCSVEGDGSTTCACDAGHHEEGAACVPDEECTETTCNGRGVCELTAGVVSCDCEPEWAGAACDACAAGYHTDGMGGCTMDACLPNPCVSANRSVCSADGSGGYDCACDAGFHEEGAACVVDETCTSSSCNGRGSCTAPGGVVMCGCETGWTGTYCDGCDEAMGYHDDGAGDCTTDVCLPNPCTVPNRGVCTDVAGSASCACETGYHDDGVGGCTTDPCVPDPCAASGRLCRDAGAGAFECFVPTCNDNEPCTDDSFDGTTCVHTPRANGASCSTTLCRSNQTCTDAVCGGGSGVSCDDANACTDDACDALTGCENTPDDSNVPDDGYACTVDTCSAGVAANAADDGVCTDGLFCTGVESCSPSSSGADANGCVTESVPVAPGPDGPCGSWACEEGSGAFVLNAVSAGSSCDDLVSCTSGDVCDGLGACGGTPGASCEGGPATCASTTPFGMSGVDVPRARALGAVTVSGGPAVASGNDDEVALWLRDQATGSLVFIEEIDFDSWDGSEFPVRSYNFRDDRVIDLDVIPGTYDVLYRRFWSTGDEERDFGDEADGSYPY
ncbi:MAG: hypothetical protein AB8I08_08875, partial [Sandaracinaceae bacterium]